ncbi:MAG: anthrone oxygenase family protein [Chloroflexota bacterium]
MLTGDNLLFVLTLVATIGSGLMAGLFFVFSVCVMQTLAERPDHEGMAMMQTINITIINPTFLIVFLGTATVCVSILFFTFGQWNNPGASYAFVGSLLYLIGSLFITAVYHVPKNNALGSVSPTTPDSASLWANYLTSWTVGNHVRAIMTLAAMIVFALALSYQ